MAVLADVGSRGTVWRAVVAVAGLIVAGAIGWAASGAIGWWRAPAVVADHATASSASLEMRLGGTSELAQWVVPEREGLSSLELVLASEAPSLSGDVVVRIEAVVDGAPPRPDGAEWPPTLPAPDRRTVLREVRLPAAMLPVGGAFGTGQGAKAEPWTAIRFDPVVPSAGRALLVVVGYPTGGTQAGTRVSTLAKFPSAYAPGELYVNAYRGNGTLLVRLASDETNAASVRRVFAHLAARLPFGEVSGAVVIAVATASSMLWVAITLVVGVPLVVRGRRNRAGGTSPRSGLEPIGH